MLNEDSESPRIITLVVDVPFLNIEDPTQRLLALKYSLSLRILLHSNFRICTYTTRKRTHGSCVTRSHVSCYLVVKVTQDLSMASISRSVMDHATALYVKAFVLTLLLAMPEDYVSVLVRLMPPCELEGDITQSESWIIFRKLHINPSKSSDVYAARGPSASA